MEILLQMPGEDLPQWEIIGIWVISIVVLVGCTMFFVLFLIDRNGD